MITGLIGMIHLAPLPGSPRPLSMDAVVTAAVDDAAALAEAGFDALMVENYGDVPFYADEVPPITVAAMTRAVGAVVDAAAGLPVGVNVLRNDARAALAVAAATGASFIRVNVLSGSMHTDQGPITGRAAEVARMRSTHAPGLEILADVMVKHATPPPGTSLGRAAADLWERGGADGIVVSGSATGSPLAFEDLETVRSAVPDAPIYAGSGATLETVATLLERCAGIIVGTATKEDAVITNPVDPERARALVEAAR